MALNSIDHLIDDVDNTMEAIDAVVMSPDTDQLCPYHAHQVTQSGGLVTGLDPMDRFMMEDIVDQGSVYHRYEEGTLSITKACTCAEIISAKMLTRD
jgi:hypothetical protein